MYEDSIFNFEYMLHIRNMLISDKIFYAYRKNLGSVTTQFKGMSAVQDIANNFRAQMTFWGEQISDTAKRKVNKHYSYSMISQIYTIYRAPKLTDRKGWLRKYVSFGNGTLSNWLTYLDNGIPYLIGQLLIMKKYSMASTILSLIFNIEKLKDKFKLSN